MTKTQRWKNRPPSSNWGDFGPDDQMGRKNLLTDERVMRAMAEVRTGKRFCLSLPLDVGPNTNPRRPPPRLQPVMTEGRPYMNFPRSIWDPKHTDVVSDDTVQLTLQYSTQWDALAHYGSMFDADGDGRPEMVYYNGFRANEHIVGPVDYMDNERPMSEPIGARALGIETMAEACVQGRGVMIDLAAHFPLERKAVGYDDLMRVMDADGVVVEEGDMVCVRTGMDRLLLALAKAPDPARIGKSMVGLNGRDERLLNWITDSGMAALIADNTGVELHPSEPCDAPRCAGLPLHEHCLFKLGIHLGEMFLLSDLADWLRANGRSRFLLTAPPLRLPGACGSPANAIATV